MKRQIKYLMAFIVAAVSLFAVAFMIEKPMIVRINKGKEAKTIEMQLANLEKQRTHIAIQDMEGKVWHSQYVWRKNGFVQRFNLNALPDGDYLCFVQNEKELFTRGLEMNPDDVAFFEMTDPADWGKSRLLYAGMDKPSIVRIAEAGSASLDVQVANLQRQYAIVQLHALGESVIFERNFKGKDAIAEKIHFNGVTPGHYFIYVKVGNASVMQMIEWSSGTIKLGNMEYNEHYAPIPVIPTEVIL